MSLHISIGSIRLLSTTPGHNLHKTREDIVSSILHLENRTQHSNLRLTWRCPRYCGIRLRCPPLQLQTVLLLASIVHSSRSRIDGLIPFLKDRFRSPWPLVSLHIEHRRTSPLPLDAGAVASRAYGIYNVVSVSPIASLRTRAGQPTL